MDAGHILVAVMTSAAVAWLVWVEVRSRRNAAVQSAGESSEAAESSADEGGSLIRDRRASRKDKTEGRALRDERPHL